MNEAPELTHNYETELQALERESDDPQVIDTITEFRKAFTDERLSTTQVGVISSSSTNNSNGTQTLGVYIEQGKRLGAAGAKSIIATAETTNQSIRVTMSALLGHEKNHLQSSTNAEQNDQKGELANYVEEQHQQGLITINGEQADHVAQESMASERTTDGTGKSTKMDVYDREREQANQLVRLAGESRSEFNRLIRMGKESEIVEAMQKRAA
jgi:hypothetical protein